MRKDLGKLLSISGDADSYNEVGECLEYAIGTKANMASAAMYYKKASDAGSKKGDSNYGYCVFHGRSMPPNPAYGFKLLTRASQAGEVGANVDLARCYETGIQVERRSPSTAFKLIESAYQSRVIWAARKTARYYELGIGTDQDESRAALIYKEVYEGGGMEALDAQPHFALALILGRGIEQNVRKGWRLKRRRSSSVKRKSRILFHVRCG